MILNPGITPGSRGLCSLIRKAGRSRITPRISSSKFGSIRETTESPSKRAARHLVGLVPPPPTYYAASTQPESVPNAAGLRSDLVQVRKGALCGKAAGIRRDMKMAGLTSNGVTHFRGGPIRRTTGATGCPAPNYYT